jgi:hypothetical protein
VLDKKNVENLFNFNNEDIADELLAKMDNSKGIFD